MEHTQTKRCVQGGMKHTSCNCLNKPLLWGFLQDITELHSRPDILLCTRTVRPSGGPLWPHWLDKQQQNHWGAEKTIVLILWLLYLPLNCSVLLALSAIFYKPLINGLHNRIFFLYLFHFYFSNSHWIVRNCYLLLLLFWTIIF